ncbi:MAG TPA: DUF805 domain-containing protein [Alphaproteobacteria bacterium]|nr:DUF805 domain-containing protein [Alphaproteobacteria bacterium]HNS44455.1 DUF805 domain-containing protein [Alphaproteobacteria bacterium]
MNFPDAVKSGFDNYINFEGRASRSEYWWWWLFYMLAYAGAIVIDIALSLGLLSVLISLALLAPSLSIGARRLHDINKSGWWQLLVLIPLIGPIILIIWYCMKGNLGENRFGPPVV